METMMHSLSAVSTTDFQRAVTPEKLRVTRIIFLGLAAGVVMFAGIVGLVYATGVAHRGAADMLGEFKLFSIINLAAAAVLAVTGRIAFGGQFSSSRLQNVANTEIRDTTGEIRSSSAAEKCVALIRTAWLVRLAIMEGAAFFGLMVTMDAVTSGIAFVEPLLMANMLSAVPLLLFVAVSFPTVERFTNVFESRIQNRE